MPRPPRVAPVRVKKSAPFDGWEESHPSYGMIGLSRVQGTARLFGSRVPLHHDFIMLRIHRATRQFSYGRESVSAAGREQLIEVALSSVQFARMLTEMNMGDGVPCTLRYVAREEMPEVPEVPVELSEARAEAMEKTREVGERVKEGVATLREKLAARIPKALMGEVEAVFDRLLTDVRSNIPFYEKQVDEAAERAAAAAQAEVDAYITSAVHRAGLVALADPEIARRLLAPPDKS